VDRPPHFCAIIFSDLKKGNIKLLVFTDRINSKQFLLLRMRFFKRNPSLKQSQELPSKASQKSFRSASQTLQTAVERGVSNRMKLLEILKRTFAFAFDRLWRHRLMRSFFRQKSMSELFSSSACFRTLGPRWPFCVKAL